MPPLRPLSVLRPLLALPLARRRLLAPLRTSVPPLARITYRSFHRSPTRRNEPKPENEPDNDSYSPTSLTDPTRADLTYHLLTTPSSEALFALSFLPEYPPHLRSKTIIGFLPAVEEEIEQEEGEGKGEEVYPAGGMEYEERKVDGEAYAVEEGGEAEGEGEQGDGAGLNDFIPNPAFLEILHDVIKASVAEDEVWIAEAQSREEGWMHISDARNPPAPNRVPDPDDIIGTVLVKSGRIVPDTYEPMPTYRLCTTAGVLTLSPGLHERLKERLGHVHEEEVGAEDYSERE